MKRALHLLALCAFAFAQPCLDVLGKEPTFFVAHHATAAGVASFAVALVVVPAVLAIGLAALAGAIWAPLGRVVHFLLVAALVAAIVLPAVHSAVAWSARDSTVAWPATGGGGLGASGLAALAVATLLGFVFAAVYVTVPIVGRFTTMLSPAAIAFPVLFLVASPASSLVLGATRIGYSGAVIGSPAPVVFVVFDGLKLVELMAADGRIDAVRFPGFARLADRSTWYRNATTVAPFTNRAVPALVTGRLPADIRKDPIRGRTTRGVPPPTAASYPKSLFTLLAGAYRFEVSEEVTALCPDDLCNARDGVRATSLVAMLRDAALVWLHIVGPRSLEASLPSIEERWAHFERTAAAERPPIFSDALEGLDRAAAFEAFVKTLKSHDEPTLFFHHSLLPHRPFEYLPDGVAYSAPDERVRVAGRGYDWAADPGAIVFEEQRYILQLALVDRLVGRLLARLEETDLWERAVVVVTADHGLAFRAGESHRHVTDATVGEILPVPLFMKLPGAGAGRIDDRNVEIIDVVPTIADVLDVDIPWDVDGISALGAGQRPEKVLALVNKRHRYAADLPERAAALSRKLEVVGAGTPPFAPIYGELADLVGRETAELAWGEIAELGVEVAAGEGGKDGVEVADPAHAVPAFVQGRIVAAEPRPRPLELAVIVGARVAGVTETFSCAGSGHACFETMVAGHFFLPGANALEVVVLERDGETTLARRPRSIEIVPAARLGEQ